MSGSVFLYEPFYDIDRLFDHVFANNNNNNSNPGGTPTNRGARSRALENGGSDGAVRSLKPRYAPLPSPPSPLRYTNTPLHRMDLHENAATNTVTATFELPGLAKSDVQLDVHNGRLTVAAESRAQPEHAEGYAVRERRFGRFARVLQLPEGVKVGGCFP